MRQSIRRHAAPWGAASALAMTLLLGTTAPTSAEVNVGITIGTAPPPPVFVFEDEPQVILVPRSRVYYVAHHDFDLFRYGRYWYINRGGWWYRSRSYSGPFVTLEYAKLPVEIVRVPAKYHRHPLGGPPGKTGIHPGKGAQKAGYGKVQRKDWDAPGKGNNGKGKGKK